MSNTTLLKSSLACALSLGMASVAPVALAAPSQSIMQPPPQMQMTPKQSKMQMQKTMAYMKKNGFTKCYGVNAAYKNDCKSPGHSCAGQDGTKNDPNAYVAMPAGLCKKIAGGSLTKGA
jgi:uncharacterized membrane protein